MNKKYIILLLTAFLFFAEIKAQKTTTSPVSIIATATSPNGNYINVIEGDFSARSFNALEDLDYFIIERMPYANTGSAKKENDLKKIGIARVVQNIGELKKYFSDEGIEQMKKSFQLKSNTELVNYFKEHKNPKDFSLYYLMIETRMAMGQLFLDKDVQKGEIFVYRITRMDKDKTQKEAGFRLVESKVGNYTLPYLKPKLFKVSTAGTSVDITWKLLVNDSIINAIPKPKSGIKEDVDGVTALIPLSPKSLHAKLFLQKNGGWVESENILPSLNTKGDTITYLYSKESSQDESVSAYIQLEDEVYNPGLQSDTAFAFAVDKKTVPLIYGIKVTEITNAIQIGWDPLPIKSYISGIQVLRYNSQDKLDSLAFLSNTDTSFIDYKIEIGQQYRYEVKVIYIPQVNMKQEIGAQGVGTYSKFSKPKPPANLAATTVGKNVSLKWEWNDDPSLFGFFIYRGISPDNLSVIAGPVNTKTYTDSAANLSGRSDYYYAVLAQNLRQDNSFQSNTVKISPNRRIENIYPKDINFYSQNSGVTISWNDVRKLDNSIQNFIVAKKKKADTKFTFLTATPTKFTSIVDTNIVAGITYEYKIAGINFKGDTSQFSEAAPYLLDKEPVEIIESFYVRNIKDAVDISWPSMELGERKTFNIYRRDAASMSFSKIGSVAANAFSFIDRSAKSKSVYVYALTITNKDDREGAKSKSISIRKD